MRGVLKKVSAFPVRKVVGCSRNFYNRFRYGKESPRFNEVVWVVPDIRTLFISRDEVKSSLGVCLERVSGKVINEWPLKSQFPITEHWKISRCIAHWSKGIPWSETGVFEKYTRQIESEGKYKRYGFRSIDDVKRRYESLDKIFQQVKLDGRLRTDEEVTDFNAFQGIKGLGVAHFGPGGSIYWSGGSQHRLAIAYVLNVPIPATIGAVHVSAIPGLVGFREEPFLRMKNVMSEA